jgi:hypothetical protein
MVGGVATITYWADDLAAAAGWSAELVAWAVLPAPRTRGAPGLCRVPHRRRPGRAGPGRPPLRPQGAAASPGGVITSWHVDAVAAALARLVSMGARVYQPSTAWGTRVRHGRGPRPVRERARHQVQPHYLAILQTPRRA